jgi:phosphate-selective porin OprO/OprP
MNRRDNYQGMFTHKTLKNIIWIAAFLIVQFNGISFANDKENNPFIILSPGPRIKTEEYQFGIFGRLQSDMALYNDDRVDHPDGTELRRARLGVKGIVADEWKYKLDVDFAGDSVDVKDVYGGFIGLKPFSFLFGQSSPGIGLENESSSRHIVFLERSAIKGFMLTYPKS